MRLALGFPVSSKQQLSLGQN